MFERRCMKAGCTGERQESKAGKGGNESMRAKMARESKDSKRG
jgi:hypothetical protein